MLKIIVFYTCLCCILFTVAAESMIGPGTWRMLKIERKTGLSDKFEFDIVQRKYNRTHDMFQGSITFHEELNDNFGARIDICKHVDGGCKQYQVLSDNSFGDLVGKYAKSNFVDMLTIAGMENPDFPVPEGNYKIPEYLWDWKSMPDEGPYGWFDAECCVMEKTAEAGCLIVEVLFEETDEDEDDE